MTSVEELASRIVSDLNALAPGSGALTHRPTRSALGTPLFFLRWRGEPDMTVVRAVLDAHHPRVSVMFDRGDGSEARHDGDGLWRAEITQD